MPLRPFFQAEAWPFSSNTPRSIGAVTRWRLSEGRSGPLEAFQTPTLEVEWDNADNRFDLDQAAPVVQPGDRISIVPQTFDAYVGGTLVSPPGGGAVNSYWFDVDEVRTSHGTGADSAASVTGSGWISRVVDQRSLGLWPSTTTDPVAFLNALHGSTIVEGDATGDTVVPTGGTLAGDETFWDIASGLAKANGAVVYPTTLSSGIPGFRYASRQARFTNALAIWRESPIIIGGRDGDAVALSPIELVRDRNEVRTIVTFDPVYVAGVAATVEDSVAVGRYGPALETLQAPYAGGSPAAIATRLLNRYTAAPLRPNQVDIDLDFSPTNVAATLFSRAEWAETLVAVRATKPDGTDALVGCLVEGRDISHVAGENAICRLTLTPCTRDGYAAYGASRIGGGYGSGRYFT